MSDLEKIRGMMLEEAKNLLKEDWDNAQDYIAENLINLTHTLEVIKKLEEENKITPEEAETHLEIWQNSCQANLAAAQVAAKIGPSVLVNGMVKVAKNVINRYVGFPLL